VNSHNQQKSKKYLLTAGFLAAVLAVLFISSNLNSDYLNFFGKAQSTAQVVKFWNFDKLTEGWKSRFTREVVAKNGNLNVRIGRTFFSPFIFNRRVFAQMPLPLKYFSINLAIQKRKEFNLPPNQPTIPPVEPLTIEDIQILSLPEQTASPSATDQTITCTDDVKSCTDGTFVGRTGPNCDFLPCPERPSSFFTFDLQFKTVGSSFWSKPFPITGKISPNFSEFTTKIPVFNPLFIEAIKLEFRSGIGRGDVILIDSIKLLNEKLITPTRVPTKTIVGCNQPCSPSGAGCAAGLECMPQFYIQATDSSQIINPSDSPPPPYLCRNPKNPADTNCASDLTSTPTPPCVNPPSCYYGGITDEQGNRLWCDPPPGVIWCPRPGPTIVTDPCTPRPPCADGIDSPEGYKMFCYPPTGGFWCPKPTITRTPTPSPAEPTPTPCAVPTAPICEGGTLSASNDSQTPGVCPPKYVCILDNTPTPPVTP